MYYNNSTNKGLFNCSKQIFKRDYTQKRKTKEKTEKAKKKKKNKI